MKYNHREAFCLMYYQCNECQHYERLWNSRDGVTPFCTSCPSCGQPSMYHVYFGSDKCEPDYKPHKGQRIWANMSLEKARYFAKKRIELGRSHGYEPYEGLEDTLTKDFYGDGNQPYLVVYGYEEKLE